VHRALWIAICSLGLAISGAAPARAAIVFTNLGPGGSYEGASGWTVYGTSAPIKTDRASRFVPQADFTLDSIQAGFTFSAGVNAGDLYLRSDSGGVPGAILESFHLVNLPAFSPSIPVATALATATSTLHPLLSSNVRYWVTASANDNSFLGFNTNLTHDTGLASRDNNGPWGFSANVDAGAFQVTGTSIPEPSSAALAMIIAAATFARRPPITRP